MNLEQLASAIFDAQPDTLDTESLIAVSAMPDNLIVRSYYCDPRSGVDILADYTTTQLELILAPCNSLADVDTAVTGIYASQPLTADERNHLRNVVLSATMEAVYDVAHARDLYGHAEGMQALTVQAVNEVKSYFGQFQQ